MARTRNISTWAVVAAVCAATVAPRAQAQAPSFTTKIEMVRVDVLVSDRGQPLIGLAPADFEILDNGVPQQVELVSFEQIPLNVILTLDLSSSVAGERLANLQAAGGALLAGLKTDDQAAVISFSHLVALGSGLTTDLGRVRRALDEAEASGETSMVDGVYAAIALGESDAGRALVIVFSDGLDTASWLSADAVLDIAKRSDAVVYAVSAQSRARPEFLRDLTSFTGGRLFEVQKTANLGATFLSILDEFRHRYLVSYTPRGVSKDGWHKLDVRVKRGGTVKARPGYLAGS